MSFAKPSVQLIRFLRIILLGNRNFVINILFFGLIVSALSLAIPISVQTLVNAVAFTGLTQPVFVLSLLLFVILCSSGFFQVLQAWLIDLFHRKILAFVGSEISNRLFLAKSMYHQKHNTPELVNRFFDVFTVQKSMSILFTDGFALILQLLVGLTLIAFYHPLFLIFDAFLLIFLFGIWVFFGPRAMDSAIVESKAKYELANWLEEQGRSYPVLSNFNIESMVLERSESFIEKYVSKRRIHFNHLLIQIILLVSLFAISSAMLLGLGGFLVIENQLSIGQLVAAEIIVTSILSKLSKSGKYLELFYDLTAASDKLLALFDVPIENLAPSIVNTSEVDLHIDNLYAENRKKIFALSKEIPFRSRIFFEVIQGSCKQILVDKIFGSAESVQGQILFNQIPASDICSQELNTLIYHCGFPTIIEGSIRDNLLFGSKNISSSQIQKALELVDLKDSIADLPQGLETQMVPNGFPLWQNQLIRMDIARAILFNPKVVILSESFHSIGQERQEKILAYLTAENRNWTLLHFGYFLIPGVTYDDQIQISWNEK